MSVDWESRTPTQGAVSIEQVFARKVKVLLLAGLVGLGMNVLAIMSLVGAANNNPPVVTVIEDGRAYYTVPENFQMSTLALERQMEDIIYVLFTRTEEEYPERLKHFCGQALIPKMQKYYKGVKSKYPSGYFQSGKVMEAKLKRRGGGRIEVWFEILVESRSEDETTQNTFYISTEYNFTPPSPENAYGWILNKIVRIDKATFMEEERKKQIEEETRLSKNEN
jgi:hypothetical protein